MKEKVKDVTTKVKDLAKPKTYYVVGFGEYGDFTAGGDTFISDIIKMAGGDNVAKDSKGWSYSLEKIVEDNPDIFICSEYFNTKETLINSPGYKEIPAIKNGKLYTIDNNKIVRQGPRIADGLEELARILHPEAFNWKDQNLNIQ